LFQQGQVLVKNIISICLLLLLPLAGQAQTPSAQRRLPVLTEGLAAAGAPTSELGRPFIRNYTPKEFGAAPSNWAIAQDRRGVMYFGNAEGILEYDGVSWRRIATPNRTVVRSLAVDPNGRIYVGEVGTFGYLAPDSLGSIRFISLLEHVPPAERKFADVLNICVTSQGVYFITRNTLFRWADHVIRIWKAQRGFQFASVVRGTLYVGQKDLGLMRMAGDSLQLVAGGERFASERIHAVLPYHDHQILIGTMENGLFLSDGIAFHPFRTQADSLLKQNQLYRGIILPDGTIALATLRGGVVILDQQGQLRQRVDKTVGLQDNTVLALQTDRHGGLWLGLFNGIAHVETPSPLSLFGEETGLKGGVVRLIRHRGRLYVATSLGVFYLDPARPHTTAFQSIAGIATQCWSFLAFGNDLLVATTAGVYKISKNKTTNLGFIGAAALQRSRKDSNCIFVGMTLGLALLRWNNGQWINAGKFPGIEEEIRSIAEGEDGAIWLGTKSQGILRLAPPTFEPGPATSRLERFGVSQGLPEGEINVYAVGKRLFFASRNGLFRYDQKEQRFHPDSTFGTAFADGTAGVEVLAADKRGNVWLVATSEAGDEINLLLRQADESFRRIRVPFLRVPKSALWAVYPDDDDRGQNGKSGVVWYGGAEGLVRYDQNVPKNYAAPFSVLIRRVTVADDSVLYSGSETRSRPAVPTVSYAHNALRFEFAAPSYDNPAENQFQSMLEGFDDHWSAWSKETKRDYTNLPFGGHRFRVRAQNIYQHVSEEAVYAFKILPPWYRTWWAYAIYGLILAAGVFTVDRVQRRRLIKKERERAQLREAQLRAEAENERRKNVELLSAIGKEITASLDMDTIFYRLYEHVNQLADATIFGVGVYHPEKAQIEYRFAIEKGKRYAPYTRDTRDKNQFPVWCIEKRQPVFINDVTKEYHRYISVFKSTNTEGMVLEDGTLPEEPFSIIYLPLISQDKVLGVITIQSFQKNAYTDYHLNLLQNLAAYTAIALDNAEAYHQVDAVVQQLNATLENLKAAQQQLVTQQKLASLGQLTAGIAHEIKNPLNFVNNFAVLSIDLANELVAELKSEPLSAAKRELIEDILYKLRLNAAKINEHGKRADSIVRSMLQHSRDSSGRREMTDLNALLDQSVSLSYHGLRAQSTTFNLIIEREYDPEVGQVEVVPQNLSRVFLNILNNACYALDEKKKKSGEGFSPTLSVTSKRLGNCVEIRIRDNGNGIPKDIREKIFNPFFTTKPSGQGTGLGLSISHDIIVQEHGGEIKVETEEGKFTEFVVRLPKPP
jgi:signal transduction histidine kinase/ligand-binding sensor domain-containing protein